MKCGKSTGQPYRMRVTRSLINLAQRIFQLDFRFKH